MKKLNLSLFILVFLMVSCTDTTTILSDQNEVNEQNSVSEEDLILNEEDSLLHIPSNTIPYKIGYIVYSGQTEPPIPVETEPLCYVI